METILNKFRIYGMFGRETMSVTCMDKKTHLAICSWPAGKSLTSRALDVLMGAEYHRPYTFSHGAAVCKWYNM
jgi:hypothetical protein